MAIVVKVGMKKTGSGTKRVNGKLVEVHVLGHTPPPAELIMLLLVVCMSSH